MLIEPIQYFASHNGFSLITAWIIGYAVFLIVPLVLIPTGLYWLKVSKQKKTVDSKRIHLMGKIALYTGLLVPILIFTGLAAEVGQWLYYLTGAIMLGLGFENIRMNKKLSFIGVLLIAVGVMLFLVHILLLGIIRDLIFRS